MESLMIFREKIGIQLKAARKEKKLSQTEAGKLIGVDHAKISKIESGHFTGSLKTYEKYITALGFHLAINREGPQMPDYDSIHEMFNDE